MLTHVQKDLPIGLESILGRGSAACDAGVPSQRGIAWHMRVPPIKSMKPFYALQLSDQIGEESMFVWPKGVSFSVQMHVFPQRTCEAYERRKLQFGIADL